MQLHNLSIKLKKAKRVARGGKRGKTAGRGTKGQKSRAGHRIRPAQRDYLIRLPKLRGYKNNPKGPANLILNLAELSEIKGEIINRDSLKIHFGKKFRNEIKILGNGEIKKAIKVEGIKISKIAKDKIEKAGGSVK